TIPDPGGQTLLAIHPRAVGRGARIVDETHWDGLPTGAGRRVTTGDALPSPRRSQSAGPETGPLQALLNRAAAANVEVGRRPLSVYDELTGTRPFTSPAPTKEAR
ncbi:IS21 family transposase, partial [Streptomyces sp. NPDC047725]